MTNVSYAQLGAIHQKAGELEISARRAGRKLPGGLFHGSLKSTTIERADVGDDVIVYFARYEAPTVIRRYSYFGNAVRIDEQNKPV